MPTRRTLLGGALGGAALTLLGRPGASLAQAGGYPAKPIHIVVGFPAGNTTDVVARVVAEHLRIRLGQPVIVDNKPGANGLLAAAEVARAPADGYTLLATNSSGMTVNPQIYRKPGYQMSDFAPVTMVTSAPLIVVVNTASPRTAGVKTLADLIALARAKPGELRYGSGGPGNITGLSFELLGKRAGFTATHVPYKGTVAAQLGLLGQEVDLLLDTPLAVPQIRAGKLAPLAVTGPRRWRDLPDTPTVQESGFPDFEVTFFLALMAPVQTPPAVVRTLYSALATIRDEPNVVKQLQPHGDVEMQEPQAFGERLRMESASWGEIIRRENIQLD